MTSLNEFAKWMNQGHGRCALILQKSEDPEIYRDIALEGCRRNFAYDAQCEGTRAWFVHRLTEYFSDRSVFIKTACDAIESIDNRWGWDFHHLVDLLTLFACDGETDAADALLKKYIALRDTLISKNEFSLIDYDLDDFNHIAGEMMRYLGSDGFSAITEDIGKIIASNSHYCGDDFDEIDFYAKQILGEQNVERILGKSKREMTQLYRRSIAAAEEKKREEAETGMSQPIRRRIPRKEKIFDIPALLQTLYSTQASYEDGYDSGHHGTVSDLIDARKNGYDVPDSALQQIYETTLCSECRYKAVKMLSEAGILSNEISEECAFDCNEKIRNFVRENSHRNTTESQI